MEAEINKLIEKIENDTMSHYAYEEVIGMLEDLKHDLQNKIKPEIRITEVNYNNLKEIDPLQLYKIVLDENWICDNEKENISRCEKQCLICRSFKNNPRKY